MKSYPSILCPYTKLKIFFDLDDLMMKIGCLISHLSVTQLINYINNKSGNNIILFGYEFSYYWLAV